MRLQKKSEPKNGVASQSPEPERPRWMMTLVIAVLVMLPLVTQVLSVRPGTRAIVYPYSWTMYSR